MRSFQQAVQVLPRPLRDLVLEQNGQIQSRVEEVRLRIGRIPTLVLPEGEVCVPSASPVTAEELKLLLEMASRWSLHTVLDQMRCGFLTLEGGHRLGLCGTAVMEGGEMIALRDLSSVDLRIARQIYGAAGELAEKLYRDGNLENTLILAPPGAGKTTLLRELIRNISNGADRTPALRVSVADERGELAACWHGQCQMELGIHTDVLTGCPKATAIGMLVRSMAPQVVAVDEITAREDIYAMEQAVGCGVSLLATAHGSGIEDLKRRPLYREMMGEGIFRMVVTIQVNQGARMVQVVPVEQIL